MVFSSLTFLYLFLPAVLIVYGLVFVLPQRLGYPELARTLGNAFLLLASLFFYTWGEQLLVAVMLASTVVDFWCGKAIAAAQRRGAHGRSALIASVGFNLLTLAVFKYLNFGVDSALHVMQMVGLEGSALAKIPAITLPIGISFYTFQSMSYTIDVYRRNVEPTNSLLDFAAYVTLFPQLVAGPIVRYTDVARELHTRRVTLDRFAYGTERFIAGLAKKMLVANTVAVPADLIFDLPAESLTPAVAWIGIVCYALQIYFDFSGYSDMAIGLGAMLGFTFPENFRHPYVARSIKEFWRRWHISLSSWFRDYLFIPLGGSRGSTARTYANLWIVFLLCGLWHGANWTFIVWGAYHGAFLVAERTRFGDGLARLPRALQHAYALLVVLVGWVFFRALSVGHALTYLGAMFGFGGAESMVSAALYLQPDVIVALLFGFVFATPIAPYLGARLEAAIQRRPAPEASFFAGLPGIGLTAASAGRLALYAVGLLLSMLQLSAGTYNPFIYFRF